mmetsp:Transcript_8230/g.14112  ORF Transcript_8230/g.14112 Transcript_8230/m.14112 type:complete len:90 (-) Transcript_8230:111-380(-)
MNSYPIIAVSDQKIKAGAVFSTKKQAEASFVHSFEQEGPEKHQQGISYISRVSVHVLAHHQLLAQDGLQVHSPIKPTLLRIEGSQYKSA